MKITDLTLTLVRWDTRAASYGGPRVPYGGVKQLGVLTIQTDEGVEGHAFLGSSRQGADVFAGPLMELIKPALIGRNPLDIGAIWYDMWKRNRYVHAPTRPGLGYEIDWELVNGETTQVLR